MKILHLGKYFYPYFGGIETVTTQIIANTKQEYQTTLIHFGTNNLERKIKKVKQISCKVLFSIFSQPVSFKYITSTIREIPKSQIIHMHAPNPLAYIAYLACSNKQNTKLVIHWHSDIINKYFFYFLVKPFEDYILKHADYIIVTSRNYLNCSKPLQNYKKKVIVIPISVPQKKITNKIKSRYEKKYSELTNKEIILFVGRFVSYKGIEYLINSAEFIDEKKLIIIAGSGQMKSTINNMKKKFDKKIKVIQSPSNDEILYLYSISKLFCLPSINKAEAFGVVLIEAMSFNLPLITFKIKGSGVNFVNLNNKTGIVVQNINSKELGKKINALLNAKTLLKKYRLQSKQRYEQVFSEKVFCKNINKLYKRISELI